MKMMRKIAIGSGVVFVTLVIAAVLGVVFVDRIAKSGVEKGGTYALGVETRVNSVSLGIFSGQCSLSGLSVNNPPGFKKPLFMDLRLAELTISPSSLQKPIIEIPTLAFSDIRLDLEKANGKSNYQTILDNLSRFQTSSPQNNQGGEKKFIIKEVTISNVNVHLDLLGLGGDLTALDVPIDRITLKNVGSDGSGVDTGELTGIVVRAVLAAAVEKGGGLIPSDIAGELSSQLGRLGNLGDMGVQAAGQETKTVTELGKAVDGIGKQAEKTADELKKGIEGLFPGKK